MIGTIAVRALRRTAEFFAQGEDGIRDYKLTGVQTCALPISRTLRKRATWAEKLLWSWLRDRRFSAYKFRRQHVFGPQILDFFCVEAFLDIEPDGLHHGRDRKSVV